MQYEELYHHGILGQKWGVRRYQNEDGTLTSEGKARKNKSEKQKQKEDKKLEKHGKSYKGKKLEDMTDEELTEHIERKVKEKKLKDLLAEDQRTINDGEIFTRENFQTLGAALAVTSGTLLTVATIVKNIDAITSSGTGKAVSKMLKKTSKSSKKIATASNIVKFTPRI